MATAFDAGEKSTVIGSTCVDLTQFRPTALLPDDYDVLLIKAPDCLANANAGTCYAVVYRRNAQVPIPPRWLDGSISAQALGAGN